MNPAELAQTTGWLVIGQAEQRINNVAERFQSGGTQVSFTQVVLFCVIATISGVVLSRVAHLVAMRDGRSYFSTQRVFQQLCRLHELDWPSRRLLRRLARARQLEHPAQLFLQPAWFETAEIPVALRSCHPQLAEIQQRLFETDNQWPDAGRDGGE